MRNIDNYKNILEADKKDIVELQSRIEGFKSGTENEEQFKLYRLTRGVYGQRQLGVQMFRIKIPYGNLSSHQLKVIADISDAYASSNLHLTTRQDIQLHYVKLENSPKVWMDLTSNGLTGREACGNTVRNLTASAKAGVDKDEPFDVTPYAHAVAYYFLRNPICQEMGRKIKPAFSSSDKDTAFTFFHDFGFIPKIQVIDGEAQRGFKVLVGGGLGAVAIVAQVAYEFLPEDEIIPFMEAGLRVFDRYGEREKRQKARMKFLLKSLGLEEFMRLVEEEKKGLPNQKITIDTAIIPTEKAAHFFEPQPISIKDNLKYELWMKSNVFEQKQAGYYGVFIKVVLGDLSSDQARALTPIIKKYSSDKIRVTVNQNLLIRFIHKAHLPELFEALNAIGYAEPGYDSLGDVTACPGTDTCNLGVSNSTGFAKEIEKFVKEEYPHLLEEKHIKIKISGCMNACGQHTVGNIGFHGSSIKKDNLVIPAVQVLIGGGLDPSGKGWIADKVIKVPTKKGIDVVRNLLVDFDTNRIEDEYFNNYYERQGKKYFYELLKPLADITKLKKTDLFDWGQDHQYLQEIGVGECAGVILDVVGTIVKDAANKLNIATKAILNNNYTESSYFAYTAQVVAAKALLLSEDIKCNTQIGILSDFQEHFVESGKLSYEGNVKDKILSIKKEAPTQQFAEHYLIQAENFIQAVIAYREKALCKTESDKEIVASYYKA